ncbi:MAG: transporter substrate-binding domain-containing protein [Deltaproteobacteria bacterium]|nr:transporter substrate-binding domain-containing protein [Deltaproteobacteria bacterium]
MTKNTRMILSIFFMLFVAFWGSLSAEAQNNPQTITIAIEDVPVPPWTFPDATGLNIEMMKLVGQKLAFNIEWKKAPWKRCLEMLKKNEIDGVASGSFKEDRKEMGVYPMNDKGEVDPSRAMMMEGYTIYRLKGADLDYDGKAFKNLQGKIGAQMGYSVVDSLKKIGAQVDDGAKDPMALITKLVETRVQGIVLQSLGADMLLKNKPDLAGKIEKCSVAFVEDKPYYLILSKEFCQKYPEFSQKIWNQIKEVRESPEYGAIVTNWGK